MDGRRVLLVEGDSSLRHFVMPALSKLPVDMNR